jgi:hypothetical protein
MTRSGQAGRPGAKRRTQIGGQFAPRLIEMLESPAYRTLSLSAHRILARLEIEMGHHGGTDNGRLPCTYEDFKRYGVHDHAIAPAIRELVALGFVEVTQVGYAGIAEHRAPNFFRLTYRATAAGNPTEEWRRIKTKKEAEALASEARAQQTERSWRPSQKTNFSGGKRRVSMAETTIENVIRPTAETAITGPMAETTSTIDISGRDASIARAKRAPQERRSELARFSEPSSLNGTNGTAHSVEHTNIALPERPQTDFLKRAARMT